MKNACRGMMVLALIAIMASMLTAQSSDEQKAIEQKIAALKQSLQKQINDNADVSPEMKEFSREILLPLWQNKIFVEQIKVQNDKKVPLDDIKTQDKTWIEAEDELPIHKEMLGNACAKEIKRIVALMPAIGETFVMDNQGANVGQNALTSDYWQGDEPKWQLAYNDGKGGIAIEKEKLDKSTNIVDQKISIPVIDEKGDVIGAVCFGINKAYGQVIGKVLAGINQSDKLSDPVKNYIKVNLIQLCTNATLASEIQAQNAKGLTLDQIKETDQTWIKAEDELPIHKEMLGNACAREIIRIIKLNPAIVEAFAMDNQGANVGLNALTSDYWQGDEPKWQNSFNNAQGGIEISKVEFDKSANAQLQQVSLPILDAKGQVIGAICTGLNTDAIGTLKLAADWTVVSQ